MIYFMLFQDIQHDNGNRRTDDGDNAWCMLNINPDNTPTTARPPPSSEFHPSAPVTTQGPPSQSAGQPDLMVSTSAQTGTRSVHFQIPPPVYYPPSSKLFL